MKKARTGDSSPSSKDIQPGALPPFVIVEGRQVPIFPVSVLLKLARLVEQMRARQEGAVGMTDSNDPSPSASVNQPRPKRKRSAKTGD